VFVELNLSVERFLAKPDGQRARSHDGVDDGAELVFERFRRDNAVYQAPIECGLGGDRLAGEGYAALAPAVFDRQQPNFESGYTPDEIANARKFVANPDWGAMLRDVQAAACDQFSTVLAPGSNVYHYDHIHVDLMRRRDGHRACNPHAVSGEEVAARAARRERELRLQPPQRHFFDQVAFDLLQDEVSALARRQDVLAQIEAIDARPDRGRSRDRLRVRQRRIAVKV